MTTADTNNDIVPTIQELINPTLDALRKLGGSATNGEIVTQVIKDMELPSEAIEALHGDGRNRTELDYRLAWSRTHLRYFGMIENSSRAVWSLTSKGRNIEMVDPQDVANFVRRLQQEQRENTESNATSSTTSSIYTVDEDEDLVDKEYKWREHLLQTLLEMSPDAFERLCQRLLRESGFIEVEVTGRPSDGGIDGRGIIRLGGLIGFPVLFQCKRYASNVAVGVIRDFRGAMQGRADKGLIITTGDFTQEARREATRDGAPPIDLINGELLIDKLKELELGVSVTARMVEVVEVENDFFRSI